MTAAIVAKDPESPVPVLSPSTYNLKLTDAHGDLSSAYHSMISKYKYNVIHQDKAV